MSFLKNKTPIIWLSAIGILAYLGFLIASAPAKLLPGQFSKYHLPVNLGNVSGTLWHGKADHFYYNGIALGSIEWSVLAYTLINGKLTVDVILNGEELHAKGRVSYGLGSKLELQNTIASFKISKLAEIFQLPALAEGSIKTDIIRLEYALKQAAPAPVIPKNKIKMDPKATAETAAKTVNLPIINAQLQCNEISLPSFGIEKLGSYTLALKSEPANSANTVIARILKSHGELEISGDGQISLDRRYKTNITLKPSATAPAAVKSALSMLGQPDAKNLYQFNKTGQLDDILGFF